MLGYMIINRAQFLIYFIYILADAHCIEICNPGQSDKQLLTLKMMLDI